MRPVLTCFVLALVAIPLTAAAQEAAPRPTELPAAPSVDDPMLAPVAPPAVSIRAWDEALAHVRARSTDLKIAYEEVNRAEAQSRVALAATLPSVNLTGTATHNFVTKDSFVPTGIGTGRTVTSPTENFANGGLTVVQPLLALRAWHQIGTTQAIEDAAKLSVEDIKRTISLSVANAMVGAVTAERVAELNRVGFRTALERLSLTQRKRDLGGSATGLDVVRAQQDVEAARATLVSGDETLRVARESLGLALGLPKQVGVARDLDMASLEQATSSICRPAPSVEARADLALARARVEIADRNVTDVKYQFAPTLNAQSGVATTSIDSATTPQTTWNVQAVLSVPLWEGGARYGALRDTRAQRTQAEQRLESLRRTATVQVEQARRGVSVAEQARKVAADARALAAETDRLTRVSYMEGRGTSLELVTAAAQLRQADINLALKEFDLVRARVLAALSLANCNW
jgi:outer membrane protein TolC